MPSCAVRNFPNIHHAAPSNSASRVLRIATLVTATVGAVMFAFGCNRIRNLTSRKASPPIDFTNSIGIHLVKIPAGKFLMGAMEPYFADEYPQHLVQIMKPFLLGKFEITVGQFRQFASETGYRTEAESDGTGGWGFNPELGRCEGRRKWFNWQNPGFYQTDASPVVDVSWNDAMAFCRWLSQKEGKN